MGANRLGNCAEEARRGTGAALAGQPPLSWWRTDIGEAEVSSVAGAMRGRHISQGPLTEDLERRLAEVLEVPCVVVTTSGTVALLMALMASGVKAGDEVIVPARTFMATANAVLMLGARVRLVDVEPARPVLDANRIAEAITNRTRAIVPVHLNGRAADMERIGALARARGLAVVEDAAQALCSRNSRGFLGTQGLAGAFSMGMTKLITSGQGGFAVTRDAALGDRLRRIRNHGSIEPTPSRYDEFGMNFKFTDLQAAMALAQLRGLPEKIGRHRQLYDFYRDALRGLSSIRLLEVDTGRGELPLWIEVLCDRREVVERALRERGIHARLFLPSLAEAPYLRQEGDFPNARFFGEHGMVLPCGPDQSKEAVRAVVEALREADRSG